MGTYTTWSWPPAPSGYTEMHWEVEPLHHNNHLGGSLGCPGSSVTDADGGVLHVMGAVP